MALPPGSVRWPMHCAVLDARDASREAVVKELAERGHEVIAFSDLPRARAAVAGGVDAFFVAASVGPDAVELVGSLLDGGAGIAPFVVAYGPFSRRDAFHLARVGAACFIEDGDPVQLARSLAQTRSLPPLDPVVREHLGALGLTELLHAFRDAMVRQALALAGGSLAGTARLLRVSRQHVQRFIKDALE